MQGLQKKCRYMCAKCGCTMTAGQNAMSPTTCAVDGLNNSLKSWRFSAQWSSKTLLTTSVWLEQNKVHLNLCVENSFVKILCTYFFLYYRKRGSASYIVREVLSVRERERERKRDRRKWRHHGRAKIGDEFTLSLAKNSHNWRWVYTFPCQKFALFVSPFTLPVSPFTERSPLWRWNSQWVHTFHCQKNFLPLCSPSFKWHEPRDEWSKTQDKWSNPAQSYIVLPNEKMNQINTKNYWK